MLGCPEAALADAENALENAREIGHAATLMHASADATARFAIAARSIARRTLPEALASSMNFVT